MPSMSISHSVPLNVSIDDAWAKLQSEQTWAGIGPISSVSNPKHSEDGMLEAFEWDANVGGKVYHGTAKTIEATAPTRFVLDMDTSEIVGHVTTVLTETGETCDATASMDLTTQQVEDLATTI